MLPSRIFFDNFFDDLDSPKKQNSMMKCDIYETESEYHIEMDTPGFKKEEINAKWVLDFFLFFYEILIVRDDVIDP